MKYERQYVDFSKVCQLIIAVSNPYYQTDKDRVEVIHAYADPTHHHFGWNISIYCTDEQSGDAEYGVSRINDSIEMSFENFLIATRFDGPHSQANPYPLLVFLELQKIWILHRPDDYVDNTKLSDSCCDAILTQACSQLKQQLTNIARIMYLSDTDHMVIPDKDTINILADALIRDLERVATKSDFDL